jgi:hypothetical protein
MHCSRASPSRLFFTPPLEPNSKYAFDVVVRWRDASGEHSLTRHVTFRSRQDLNLDFTKQKGR